MAKELLPENLWQKIEPLLPPEPPKPKGGRPRLSDKAALTGIIFVLKTGIPWEYLPKEMGCGSGMTCWRRLRDWQVCGVWDKLCQVLLQSLYDADKIDLSRVCIDASHIQAKKGAKKQAPVRSIEENPEANITSPSIATGYL